jgi:polygalacturonase
MRIFPTSDAASISYAENLRDFRTRGVEPHSAWSSGLARSSYWRFFADGAELPVYDTPVTHGGPHSFVVIPFDASELTAKSIPPLRSAEILPESLHLSGALCGQELHFSAPEAYNLLIEANGSHLHPLAVFRANDTVAAPNPEDDSVLFLEPGIHRIRTLELKSGQTLYLSPGAILVPEQPDETEPVLEAHDWAGKPNYQDFIHAEGQKNIRVCGAGIIDLTALDWHARRSMVFTSYEDVSVSDVIFVGAAHWTLPFFGCKNVHVDRVRMLAYRENSDGIDLVDTQHALVENCFLRTGDDAICLKSMALTPQTGTHDILVRRCTVWNDKVRAFGVAGESRFGIHDAVFEDCDVLHSMADWTTEVGALAIYICDAAEVHHITFRNIRIRQESNYAICCVITRDRWSTDREAGQVHDITFEEITMPENYLIFLSGFSESNRLYHICFKNVSTWWNSSKPANDIFYEHLEQTKFVSITE